MGLSIPSRFRSIPVSHNPVVSLTIYSYYFFCEKVQRNEPKGSPVHRIPVKDLVEHSFLGVRRPQYSIALRHLWETQLCLLPRVLLQQSKLLLVATAVWEYVPLSSRRIDESETNPQNGFIQETRQRERQSFPLMRAREKEKETGERRIR
ncbi:hypothetical protein HZH68_011443 [Vespula germanica]|uniref:Uncharacterized protein n=1 Tax=Vespula germanica TaxID=30212 RepID=A0A834JPT1_VESGE|nr:hypothetical protein HZH68_011443 [Vespula germanica]